MSKIFVPVQSKLSSLIEAKARAWNEVAQVLDDVEKSGHWKTEASSFSQWVNKFAKDLKLGVTSLWRFRAGLKILQELRNSLLQEGQICPELDVLAARTNPQNLELYEKLTRVLTGEEIRILQLRILNEEVSRDELRHLWHIYRPLLDGKTARGNGVEPPKFFEETRHLQALHIQANVLKSINTSQDWLGKTASHSRTFISIDVPADKSSSGLVHLDAVILAHSGSVSGLDIHAIEILDSFQTPEELLTTFRKKAPYCHFFWFAEHIHSAFASGSKLPEGAGLLCCISDGVIVMNNPTDTEARLVGNTAIALLKTTYHR